MSEQQTTDTWFEAVKIPEERAWRGDEPRRLPPVESWKKCGHRHKTYEEANYCAFQNARNGSHWGVVKADRVEVKP